MKSQQGSYSASNVFAYQPGRDYWPEFLSLRPIKEPEDLTFLLGLYSSARENELAHTDWTEAEKAQFLTMQFNLQHQYYQQHFPEASFEILQYQNKDIGRLYQYMGKQYLNLIDIVFMPIWRNRGFGSQVLAALQTEVERLGKGIILHVEPDNPAKRLYERMGFHTIADNGPYQKMHWLPSTFNVDARAVYS